MTLKLSFFVALFVLINTAVFGQNDSLSHKTTVERFKELSNIKPVEKVYLHFDKPYYAAGDDIWLKAYVVAGPDHYLSTLSGVVDVELINDRKTIIQSIKLRLKNGTAAGDFALPDTLPGGNYRIRAYTSYMRNAGSEYFFDQAVAVLKGLASNKVLAQKAEHHPAAVSHKAGAIDLQFFPEGGELVNGLTSQVAFKAVGPNGLGVDVKGIIVDAQGRQAATMASSHFGMGKFQLKPMAGVTYSAKVSANNGAAYLVQLPEVKQSGYVLTVTDNGTIFRIIGAATADLSNATNNKVSLISSSSGTVYAINSGTFTASTFIVTIPKSKFPQGIAQFTLLNASGEPVAERLVFVRHPDNSKLLITGPLISAPRGPVKLNIDATSIDKPSTGSFSVSVVDETKVPVNQNFENNILAGLLLKPDLKGYIEQPAYYFNNESDKTRADLDVLMLTQGYRTFNREDIAQSNTGVDRFMPERWLHVSGTVTGTKGKHVIGGKVKIAAIGNVNSVLDTITDEYGRFSFNNLVFNDSTRLIIQARTAKDDRDVKIRLNSIAPAAIDTGSIWPDLMLSMQDSLAAYDKSSSALYALQRQYGLGNHIIALQEVVIRDRKQREGLKHSANLMGPGNADQVLLMKDLGKEGCMNLSDCLNGRLLGVYFYNGEAYSNRTNGRMLLVIDGIVADTSVHLNTISYSEVQSVEVLRNASMAAIYGARGFSGVLIITTKRGDDIDYSENRLPAQGIINIMPKGFYKARTFYSPKYAGPTQQDQLADLRTTIYWDPAVLTGADGKASVQYFNAGSSGTYRVVMEGIDAEGNIYRQVYRYKVQ
jgi:TonB-dependent SusC/RagA subfamily outer membrane receptor